MDIGDIVEWTAKPWKIEGGKRFNLPEYNERGIIIGIRVDFPEIARVRKDDNQTAWIDLTECRLIPRVENFIYNKPE